jgi:hypothetical protein
MTDAEIGSIKTIDDMVTYDGIRPPDTKLRIRRRGAAIVPTEQGILLVQENGRPYSLETYRRHLQEYAIKFGIYNHEAPRQMNFTFNSCRRFGVTQFMKTQIPPTYISFLRGDKIKKSKDIKEIYFDIDREDVQEKYNQHVFKLWGHK